MWFLALLKGVGAKVWGYIAGALAVLAIVAGIFRAGRRAERGAQKDRALEIKDAQLDAAANRPNTDADLDQRLRDGRF